MKVNFGLVAGIKAKPLSVADVFECCHFTHYFWGLLTSFWQKKHFPILYWNKLIQGGNALWIKYVFLNQAKRLWHFYAKRFMYAFFLVTFNLQLFKDYWLNRKIYIWKNTRLISFRSFTNILFRLFFFALFYVQAIIMLNNIEIDAIFNRMKFFNIGCLLSKPAFGWARLVLTWCW